MRVPRAGIWSGLRVAAALSACAMLPVPVRAQATPDAAPPFSGEVASLTLDRGGEAEPGGTIVVSGVRVAIPAGLRIELPATTLTLGWLFREAPARCRERGESGLAKADACRVEVEAEEAGARAGTAAPARGGAGGARPQAPRIVTELPPAMATIELATTGDGRLVAAAVRVTRNLEELMGGVTFVNPEEGYIRINGHYRQDEGGTMIRVNDPFRQHGDQRGAACGGEANCSSDTRFRAGAAVCTVRFERGNPAYVGGDAADRKIAPDDLSSVVPILVGDNVTVEGAFEIASGVRYFSAQSVVVQAVLTGGR